jgi:hypothetical protein
MEKPSVKVGQITGIYEQDQLDDEALEMIVRPNKLTGTTVIGKTTIA